MKKIILLVLLAFIIQSPAITAADECMDGDCEDGIGTGFTEEGTIYSGEWQDGLPHGSGKLTVSRGEFIEGRWEKGKLVEEIKE